MNEQQRAQSTYIDFFGQATRLWWDGFAATTRYTVRALASFYEIAWRPYPANVTQALETVHRENLDRVHRLRDVITEEAQALRDTATGLADRLVERSHEVQAATAEAGRSAMRTGASIANDAAQRATSRGEPPVIVTASANEPVSGTTNNTRSK